MKHTQGEWIVKNHAQFSNIKNIIVKDVNILSITNQRASDIESEANAALIAAAPELLKIEVTSLICDSLSCKFILELLNILFL